MCQGATTSLSRARGPGPGRTYGIFNIFLDHLSRVLPSCAPPHMRRVTCSISAHALPSARAYWALIGACNPMLCQSTSSGLPQPARTQPAGAEPAEAFDDIDHVAHLDLDRRRLRPPLAGAAERGRASAVRRAAPRAQLHREGTAGGTISDAGRNTVLPEPHVVNKQRPRH